jgi:predicted nucleic acid-binding protein
LNGGKDGKEMKLYLDLCVYNRPFDYQGQERVALETGAFIYLIEQIEKGKYTLVYSEALVYENSRNPDNLRRERISTYFKLAQDFISLEESDFERAKVLRAIGFSDMDAVHIASAEKGNIDFFITCDDWMSDLYKKNAQAIKVMVMNLLEFVAKEVK